MALQVITENGAIKIPGATVTTKIQSTAGGLGLTGVVALIGEAALGPAFSDETDPDNAIVFGPDEEAAVDAKYGSGPLVDAYREAVAAANDPEIQGSPSRLILFKSNKGSSASATMPDWAGGTWGTLSAARAGADSNLIARTVTAAQTEAVPTTGPFTVLPPINNTNIDFRVNGGSAIAYTISAADLPPATVSGINALSGVAATGGADRGIIGSASGTLALAVVSGLQVTLTRSVAWTVVPSVGDLLYVSATSVVKGAGDENVGSYVVTAATTTTISATKLLDATGVTANQVTAPVAVSAGSIASTTADARAFAPITISVEAGDPVDGLGKTLEISELTSATGRLSYVAYAKSAAVVSWISTSTVPVNLASGVEYKANVNVARQKDGLNEDLSVGGRVLLALGYKGTTGSAVVSAGTLTITVTGGAGTSPAAIKLADYSTVGDLAAYLSTLTGFSAAPGTATLSSQPAASLDAGTYGIASTQGAKNGRIKQDASLFKTAFAQSNNVRLSGTLPTSGSPKTASATFLTGGARGATADSDVAACLLGLESVDVNFVVPLFSNDAATDVADGLTDSGSTYTVDGVNASTRSHVLKMSTIKNYKPRQAVLSFRGTYAQAKAASANTASFRCAMTFEDVRTNGSTGGVVQQRPWMAAVKAAGMQAAAFRKLIVNKGVNVVGAIQAAGDFNPRNATQVEDGLDAGLLILKPADGGGWTWVSDQTTYSKDDSFFFNSLQAVYIGDVIGRTLQQRLQKAITGESVADLGRSQILSVLRLILDDLRGLKLIAPSDDAPLGYLHEDVKVKPPAVFVSVEVKEATGLYFIPISLSISAVSQTG